jgi:hypothetical protein
LQRQFLGALNSGSHVLFEPVRTRGRGIWASFASRKEKKAVALSRRRVWKPDQLLM